jgi:hypothetical protein
VTIATDHVTFFRTERTARYVDTVTITDKTSVGTWNRATKVYDTPTNSTVYTGAALLRPASATTTNRGEQGEVLYDFTLYLPDTATGIGVGNTVTVDASLLATDLVGAELTVQDVGNDSLETHRAIQCLLSQGGGDRG